MSSLARLESDKLPGKGTKVWWYPVLRTPVMVEVVEYTTSRLGRRMAVVEILDPVGIHRPGDHHRVPLSRLFTRFPEDGIPVEVTV